MSRIKELCSLPFDERVEQCRNLLAAGDLPPEEAAHVGQYLSHALYNLRRPAEALEVAQEHATSAAPPVRLAYLLELQALAMYELGMLAGTQQVLDQVRQLEGVPLPVQAHVVLIEGWILDLAGKQQALERFERAAELFGALNYQSKVDRCMLSAAAFCLRHGLLGQAVTFVDRVSDGHADMRTCLRADWLIHNGRFAEVPDLLAGVLVDDDVMSEAKAWAHYLSAVHAMSSGHAVVADTRLNRALDLLISGNYAEPVLRNKISALRALIPDVWGQGGGDSNAETVGSVVRSGNPG